MRRTTGRIGRSAGFLFAAGSVACVDALGAQESVTRLTHSGDRNGQAFYSPDGGRISFVSDRSGTWQVWLMAAEGGLARRMTGHAEPVGWPSWTAAGDTILYYAATEHGYRLYAVSVRSGVSSPIFDEGVDDFRPSVSPDGRSLLFDRSDPTGRGGHEIVVRDLATGQVRSLTADPGYDSDARWSPDGTRIVFQSDRGAATPFATQVYLMNADGSGVRRLTEGPAVHGYPSWSPDGEWLAYTSEIDGDRDVWVMRANGTEPRRITSHPGFDGEPVWTPDGRHLLFVTDRFGGLELARVAVRE